VVYLMLGEASADGAGLLGAEVEGEKLLVLVRLTQCGFLLLRDHGVHARDGGAHHLAAKTGNAVLRSRARADRIEEPGNGGLEGTKITSWRACWGRRR
jgi:hypothetical protein